jgi:transitional endoplasmic reticulum ATPase
VSAFKLVSISLTITLSLSLLLKSAIPLSTTMNDQLNNLREALAHSPNNIPLRLMFADALLQVNQLDEAEQEFLTILKQTDDIKVKTKLANVYYRKQNYASCNVILEDLIERDVVDVEIFLLHAKALLKEGALQKAKDVYSRLLEINPQFTDEFLYKELRVYSIDEQQWQEEELDHRFLQKTNINFSNVGGMENVKHEIDLKIIKPLQHPDLYKAYGKKLGGGILLFGPPGCGKTFIAKATAGQVNAKFINVTLNDILDMWIGNSEKNLHDIFDLARKNTPCVLFIDEIDALGASRKDLKQSSGRNLINQFLQELDGIDHNNEGILIIGATNAPWNLDAAFRRPGRFDRLIFVPPPDAPSREHILKLKLSNKPTNNIDYAGVAKKLDHYSGADIDAIIDISIEQKLEASFKTGVPEPINTTDLLNAIKKHKPSTQEWFASAKNFALFANESGVYNDILTYLNIKK